MSENAAQAVVETDAERRLYDLAETIRTEHRLAREAAEAMVTHAIACGDALLEAKTLVPAGQWGVWIEHNLPYGRRNAMCRNYMRLAALKQHVDPELSVRANVNLVRGLEKRSAGTPRVPEEVKQEALRLRATGEFSDKAIARMLGTTHHSVRAWADPEYARRNSLRASANTKARRARAAGVPELVPPPRDERALRYGEPGRAAIGKAVRRLAQAAGHGPTREALLDLAAIATAWADRLGAPKAERGEAQAA